MLPSFLSMETITRGLYIQQLNQTITASNLANPSLDPNGYLMNSLQQVNSTSGAPYLFGSAGRNFSVGSGPLVQSVTRLRSLFLDTQIQTESSVVGKAEILNNILNEVQGIVAGSTGTLDTALTNLANAFAALAPNPLSIALRSTVVNNGIAFATLANNQYTQLENLQQSLSGQIGQTVSDINQTLQQLSSLNKQLLGSAGTNVNSLLDARDYALDRLGRLINIQTNFGTAGTVNVYLGSSSLALVDGAGAAILQTNVMNVHNPILVDVTIQSSEGTVTLKDPVASITGGNLAGELQARDVVVESYKTQVDQIAASVISVTNMLHEAGYAADAASTGNDFFTGTGAVDINVNGSIIADPTHKLLAAAIQPGTPLDGTIAKYLGNLPSLLANNFVASGNNINGIGNIDPTQPLNTQPVAVPPASGTFTVNGNNVNYLATDTIDSILAQINAKAPNVYAVFNAKLQEFYMVSNNPILIADPGGAGSFTFWGAITNYLTSTIRMNNGFNGTQPLFDINAALNSRTPAPVPPVANWNTGPNNRALKVIPSTGGTFSINGVPVPLPWKNTMSLNTISLLIPPGLLPGTNIGFGITTPPIPPPPFYAPGFAAETVFLSSAGAPLPLQIIDTTGNFTVFTGLNATNSPVGALSSGIVTQVNSDFSGQKLVLDQASASLTQLNTAQANIAGVSTVSGQPGVPLAVIEQEAMQSLISYNASLQVLQIIDQMFADLIAAVSGGGTSTSAGTINLQGR